MGLVTERGVPVWVPSLTGEWPQAGHSPPWALIPPLGARIIVAHTWKAEFSIVYEGLTLAGAHQIEVIKMNNYAFVSHLGVHGSAPALKTSGY